MITVERSNHIRPETLVWQTRTSSNADVRPSSEQLTVPMWINDAPAVQGPVRWEVGRSVPGPTRDSSTRRPKGNGPGRRGAPRTRSNSVEVAGGGAGRGPLRYVRSSGRSVAAVAGIGLAVAWAMNFAWEAPQETPVVPVTVVEHAD